MGRDTWVGALLHVARVQSQHTLAAADISVVVVGKPTNSLVAFVVVPLGY
jgi:hypothetical protein